MKVVVHFPAIGDPPDAAFWYDANGHLSERVVRPGPSVIVARHRVSTISPDDFEDWADLVPEYYAMGDVWGSCETDDVDELLAALTGSVERM